MRGYRLAGHNPHPRLFDKKFCHLCIQVSSSLGRFLQLLTFKLRLCPSRPVEASQEEHSKRRENVGCPQGPASPCSASHCKDVCKPVSVCELLRIERNGPLPSSRSGQALIFISYEAEPARPSARGARARDGASAAFSRPGSLRRNRSIPGPPRPPPSPHTSLPPLPHPPLPTGAQVVEEAPAVVAG